MAKLIGTGKDPRFPKGQDYDVPAEEVQHHVDAALGEPVEPGAEAYASHRGYDTIAADPGEQTGAGGPVIQDNYGFTSRTAARVETTAAPGEDVAEPEAAVEAVREKAVDLEEDRGGGVALPHRGTDALETESEGQAELREEQAANAEDDPTAGAGGRGAEAARLADGGDTAGPELQGGPDVRVEQGEGDEE